ncbi:hypothetical protein KC330_g9186 [Hortaea werneckii]|nr:hypothetical protein KC330_g9186 [Hortaea werneckii]
MSAVGEASAIFGLVTGSIDLIKMAIEICQAADGNAPKRIKGVADQLPSIEQLLENARDTKDKQNNVWEGVAEDVKRCEAACRALNNIFDQACPREGSSRGRRVWNAGAVIVTGKRTKAEEHLAVIIKTLDVFKAKLIITNTKLLEDVKSAIDAFDREDGGMNHYGSGDGFWTSGGTVNVPKGGTNQFISSIGTYENKNYYGNLVLPSGSQAASAPYHEEARPKKGIEILPWPRDSRFIGREDTLKDIQKTLEEEGSVALTGPGGVGKSQAALEYVWRFRKSEPQVHVLWIYAGSVDTFDKEYRRLAVKLKLVLPGEDVDNDQMRDRVKDWLNDSENGRWLMVIDNADSHEVVFAVDELDTGVGIANALPWHRPGDAMILYTSRHADIGQKLADFNTLRLEPLSSEDSEELLRNLSGSTVSADLSQEQARRLLEALEYLPLSISHAAGWLRKKRSTVDEYLAFLEQSDDSLLEILSQDMAVGRMDRRHQSAPKSVVKAWLVTFNLLEKHDPAAANLFCLAACLDRHSISLDNFEKAIDVQAPRGWRIGKIMDLPFPVTQADLLSAVGELEDLALLRRGVGDRSFSMHRYVQAITINQLEQREILKSYYSLALQSVLHMEEQVALLRIWRERYVFLGVSPTN